MGVVTSHQATANLVSTHQEEDHLFQGHANDRTETLEGGITDGGPLYSKGQWFSKHGLWSHDSPRHPFSKSTSQNYFHTNI